MSSFHLRITTLEKIVFDEEIESVTLPGEAGEFCVLANHTALITPLKLGAITAKKDGEEFYMTVSGGMVEVQPHRVLVLADQAERAEEIDEKLTEQARSRAESLMKEKQLGEKGFASAEAELQRALLQLHILKKHKSKKGVYTH